MLRISHKKISVLVFILLLFLAFTVSSCTSDSANDVNSSDTPSDPQSDPEDDSGDDNDLPVGDAPGAVPSLSGVAYTDTEIEIFWERAVDTDGTVVGYTVNRNGTELAASLDATSYYDNSVMPAGSYGYSVAAVDDDGNRGPVTTVTIDTPTAYLAVNRDNYADIVRYVLGIFASQPMRNSVYEPFSALLEQEPASVIYDNSTTILDKQYNCENGGTASVLELQAAATGYYSVTYDNCQLGASVYQGMAVAERSEGQSMKRTFNEYSVVDASGSTIAIAGEVNQTNYVCRSDNYKSWGVNNFSWSKTDFEGATVIDSEATRFGAGTLCGEPWRADLSGDLTVRSPETGNKTLDVLVITDFLSTVPDNTNFQSGVMEIIGRDTSTLILDAGNDDPDSVAITLEHDGTTESFDEPWSTWQGILIATGTGL